jgi:hypothetical protein
MKINKAKIMKYAVAGGKVHGYVHTNHWIQTYLCGLGKSSSDEKVARNGADIDCENCLRVYYSKENE